MSNSKDDALTKSEFEQLWEIAVEKGDELDRLILILAGELGLRVSEIAHIKKSWINFQKKEIKIPSQEGDWTPKTKNSARTIPYGQFKERVSKELQHYFDYKKEIKLARNSIWYRINNMAEKTDITKEIYPHSLRATAALKLANGGLNAQLLRQFFGWQKLETAEKYIRASGAGLREGLRNISDSLY